jgi:hypothetical protein
VTRVLKLWVAQYRLKFWHPSSQVPDKRFKCYLISVTEPCPRKSGLTLLVPLIEALLSGSTWFQYSNSMPLMLHFTSAEFQVWKLRRPLPTQMEPQNLGVLSLFCQMVRGVQVQPSSSSLAPMRMLLVWCHPLPPSPSPTPSCIIWSRPKEGFGKTTLHRLMELRRFRNWRIFDCGQMYWCYIYHDPIPGNSWLVTRW